MIQRDQLAILEERARNLEAKIRKLQGRTAANLSAGLQRRIERATLTADLGTGGTATAEIQPSGKPIIVTDIEGRPFSSGDSLFVFYFHPPGELVGKWHPLTCCGCKIVFQDDFGRADNLSLGSDWTENGSLEIASNKLKATVNGDSAVYANTVSSSYYRVKATVRGTVNNDQSGVVACWTNTSNFYSAEVVFHATGGSGRLRLYKTVAGSKTQLATLNITASLSTDYELTLCIAPATSGIQLTASIAAPGLPSYQSIGATDTALSSPGKAGVSRVAGTGVITFDDFSITPSYDSNGNCVTCCEILEDGFDRANSTSLGAYWTEDAGDWSIASNKLTVATANARVTSSATTGDGATWISVKLQSSASGDKLRVYFLGTTDYVELTVGGSAQIEIFTASTSRKTCSVTAAAGTEHTLIVRGCAYSTVQTFVELNGVIVGSTSQNIGAGAGAGDCGVGTGGTLTGTAQFDDFHAKRMQASSTGSTKACPTCDECCWPVSRDYDQIKLVLSGHSNSGCTQCATLDGTYYLDKVGACEESGGVTQEPSCACYEIDVNLLLDCAVDKVINKIRVRATNLLTFSGGFPSGPECFVIVELLDTAGPTYHLTFSNYAGSFSFGTGFKSGCGPVTMTVAPSTGYTGFTPFCNASSATVELV